MLHGTRLNIILPLPGCCSCSSNLFICLMALPAVESERGAEERATASVERLLALAKKRVPGTETFKLETILERVADFAASSMDSSVSLFLPSHFDHAFISGDPGLIEQLLLNIFINAEHAMTFMQPDERKRGGAIRVELERYTPDQSSLAVNPSVQKRDYWCLAMVHSIITQHGGFVDVSTEPGRGTTFYLYLPAVEVPAAEGERPAPENPLAKGKGTILLVDDDEMVRDTVGRMISSLGYQAETAASAEEALELFGSRPEQWISVVMDNRMGGMSGSVAARHMRLICPDIPITLISGYVSDEALAMAEEEGITFLQKPFTVRALGSVLEGRGPRDRDRMSAGISSP
jgi:CheY-like chemotaxis protein